MARILFVLTATFAIHANASSSTQPADAINLQDMAQIDAWTGYGTQMDSQKAFTTLKHLADLGRPDAQNEVGVLYVEGLVVPRDLNRARDYFFQAAAAGNTDASEYLQWLNPAPPAASRPTTTDAGIHSH